MDNNRERGTYGKNFGRKNRNGKMRSLRY